MFFAWINLTETRGDAFAVLGTLVCLTVANFCVDGSSSDPFINVGLSLDLYDIFWTSSLFLVMKSFSVDSLRVSEVLLRSTRIWFGRLNCAEGGSKFTV